MPALQGLLSRWRSYTSDWRRPTGLVIAVFLIALALFGSGDELSRGVAGLGAAAVLCITHLMSLREKTRKPPPRREYRRRARARR